MTKKEFTHFDSDGKATMVDVTNKPVTYREATAQGNITMSAQCFEMVENGQMGKGDVLGIARVAGIMGAKKTSELIPLCHTLLLTKLSIDFTMDRDNNIITAFCTVVTDSKTGVEMEALTGVQIALLTIYDMCKAVDKKMVMGEIRLNKKSGGKSGDFVW